MVRLAGSAKLLRAMNESAALGHLLDGGSLTRNDLRELTGLSKPTTSEVLRRLTEAGLAVVTGHTSGGPGPNAEIYAVNPDAAYAVAVSVRDTPGTLRPALAVAVSDLTGTTRARAELSVDLEGDACPRSSARPSVPSAPRRGYRWTGCAGSSWRYPVPTIRRQAASTTSTSPVWAGPAWSATCAACWGYRWPSTTT